MKTKRYRVGVHGGIYTWFSVEERGFFGWKRLTSYLDTWEQAQEIVDRLNEQDEGK